MKKNAALGPTIRELRIEKGLTLREFARRLGLSAAYVSQVEQDRASLPTHERIEAMARILSADPDELLASAGRVASDLPHIIIQHPRPMAVLLRTVDGLSRDEVRELTRQAAMLKEKRKKPH